MSERTKLDQLSVFPEGMNEALSNLLRILANSPHSFSVQMSRYGGEKSYSAKIDVTELAYATIVVSGDE